MPGNLNIGDRFGRLIVLLHHHDHFTPGGKRKPKMLCRCDCGAQHVASLYDMRAGKTTSCGCAAAEMLGQANTTHGAATVGGHTPEYRAWRNMNTRGRNPNTVHAARYVLRGITVCAEWLPGGDGKGFERFLAHVGAKPSPSHSLDRIDNDLGYEPGNVRWATRRQQLNNQERTFILSLAGESVPLQFAAERYGIPARIIHQRVTKLGWPHERAVSVPPKPDRRRALSGGA